MEKSGTATHRLGCDIGGTFTDLVLLDEASGALRVLKMPSTLADPSAAVLTGSHAGLPGGGGAHRPPARPRPGWRGARSRRAVRPRHHAGREHAAPPLRRLGRPDRHPRLPRPAGAAAAATARGAELLHGQARGPG